MLPYFCGRRELPRQSLIEALLRRTSHILSCLIYQSRPCMPAGDHSSIVDISDISFRLLLTELFSSSPPRSAPRGSSVLRTTFHRQSDCVISVDPPGQPFIQTSPILFVHGIPEQVPRYNGIVHRNSVKFRLLQTSPDRFFRVFASTSSKIAQPHLEPSFFRPSPILTDKTFALISSIVHFALDKNKLP